MNVDASDSSDHLINSLRRPVFRQRISSGKQSDASDASDASPHHEQCSLESRMRRLRWGVMGTANIAVKKVIPGMQKGLRCEIVAIASRDASRASSAARALGIPTSHGSYDALLADPNVEAVYIPLPNHLHVPWSILALAAGKHVLCEKPIAMTGDEAARLMTAARAHPELRCMEAFMYRVHPQWERARALASDGAIGDVQAVETFFSYHNVDPANVRNVAEYGGGALMDIGCYGVSVARFIYGSEPVSVHATMDDDPTFRVDRLVSAVMDFGGRTSTFTCGTQLERHQRVNIVGGGGRIEIEIPFNAPPDRPCRLWLHRGSETEEIPIPVCDQYTVQGDRFSAAVLDGVPLPIPLEDSVANMRVIDAVRRSVGRW
jgi:predicted dehydrogenase